jgi:hypothetical protein
VILGQSAIGSYVEHMEQAVPIENIEKGLGWVESDMCRVGLRSGQLKMLEENRSEWIRKIKDTDRSGGSFGYIEACAIPVRRCPTRRVSRVIERLNQ